MVLLFGKNCEQEILRQLGDQSTYLKLKSYPFPVLVNFLNFKLQLAFEAQLLTKKELNFTLWYIPTIYIIPKVQKSQIRPREAHNFSY